MDNELSTWEKVKEWLKDDGNMAKVVFGVMAFLVAGAVLSAVFGG